MAADQNDVGRNALDQLFSVLQVDPEWSLRKERGFSWWASRLVTPLLHGEPDLTPRPKSGLRSEPEASLGNLKTISTDYGKRPSAFEGDDLPELVRIFSCPPCLLANGDEASLVAEFPFLGESSLVRFTTQEPHQRLGNGLRARWVAEKVFHDDWARVPAKPAVERLQLAERPS